VRASIESVGESPVHIGQSCANCTSAARCRKRDFSEQAWTVLLAWGEVENRVVDQPICDDCYVDLREILIDRGEELAKALANPESLVAQTRTQAADSKKKKAAPAVKKKTAARVATPAKKKTRRVA